MTTIENELKKNIDILKDQLNNNVKSDEIWGITKDY